MFFGPAAKSVSHDERLLPDTLPCMPIALLTHTTPKPPLLPSLYPPSLVSRQRLESFYKNLCGLDGTPEPPAPASPSIEKASPLGRPPKAPKLEGEPISPTGSASKTDYPQIRVSAAASSDMNREPKENYPLIIAAPTDIQEELTLESLGMDALSKLYLLQF